MTDQPQIYLHIGAEKTGTTALQAACDMNREQLARNGICYPKTPGLRNQILLTLYACNSERADDLRRVADLVDPKAYRSFRQSFPEKLVSELQESGCEKVLLSNEHMSSRIRNANEVGRLAELLRRVSDDIRVLVYVRRQDECLLSAHSTSAKSGVIETLESKLNVDVTDPVYNYDLMLRPWTKVFGKEALMVKVYERSKMKDGDLVADIFSILDYTPDASMQTPPRGNSRLDAYTLAFLLEFNRHVPASQDSSLNPLRGNIGAALEVISDGPKPKCSAEDLQKVIDRFANSNRLVAREYLGIENGQLFSNSRVADYDDDAELTVEKAIEIAAHMWTWKQEEVVRLRERLRDK
jgi:hypothetical protein